jgi:hypothetical protein
VVFSVTVPIVFGTASGPRAFVVVVEAVVVAFEGVPRADVLVE